MAQTQEELQTVTTELTVEAFNTFCEDIATMFDTNVTAVQEDIATGTVAELKSMYKKLAAVCSVTAEGAVNGEFHVVFDKDGVFTLPGTFVMQPEQIIRQNRKNGGQKEAEEVGDALGEVGNLLVGAWDKVFREELEDHKHFVQSGTFIGNPWTKPTESLRLTKEEELAILTFEMTVEPLDAFKCSVIYPVTVFEPAPEAEADEEDPQGEDAEQPQGEEGDADQQQEETAAGAEPAATEEATETAPPAEEPADEQSEPTDAAETTEPAQPQERPVSDAIAKIAASQTAATGQPVAALDVLTTIKAQDIMRAEVAWADPEDSIEHLTAVMQQNDTAYVMIGENHVLQGIISKSDVRGALSPYLQSMFAKWRNPMDIATLQIKAKWAMSQPVRTVRPDATLAAIMSAMTEHGGRCMPVVDQQGKVCGLVTAFDVFHALLSCRPDITTQGQTPQTPPLV
jgi:CBS domain-containing protein